MEMEGQPPPPADPYHYQVPRQALISMIVLAKMYVIPSWIVLVVLGVLAIGVFLFSSLLTRK